MSGKYFFEKKYFFQNQFSKFKNQYFSMIFSLNLIYASSAFQRARSQLQTLKTMETGTLLVSESCHFDVFESGLHIWYPNLVSPAEGPT